MDQAGATARSRSLHYDRTIGLATMEGRGFFFPSDTALGRDGRIFTVSRGIDIDGRTVRITVYDLESEFFGTFGGIGEGDGQFTSPTSLATDSTGRVYVSDEYTHRIVVFEPDGDFVADWAFTGRARDSSTAHRASPLTRRTTFTSQTTATSGYRSSPATDSTCPASARRDRARGS